MNSSEEEARIQRDLRISRRKTAKDLKRENRKVWMLIIRDGLLLIAHGIALLIIGIGVTIAAVAVIGIIAWGLYSLIMR